MLHCRYITTTPQGASLSLSLFLPFPWFCLLCFVFKAPVSLSLSDNLSLLSLSHFALQFDKFDKSFKNCVKSQSCHKQRVRGSIFWFDKEAITVWFKAEKSVITSKSAIGISRSRVCRSFAAHSCRWMEEFRLKLRLHYLAFLCKDDNKCRKRSLPDLWGST